MHFEDLWTQAEEVLSSELNESLDDIVQRIVFKLNAMNSLLKQDKPAEEMNKIKQHVMGEILLDLTHISAKENINVYQALQIALHYKKIGNLQGSEIIPQQL